MTQNLAFDEWFVRSSYQQFVQQEGAPLYQGSYLEDMSVLELADWERRGGKVAYTRLGDSEINCIQIVEIPPGGQLKPEHHMYDAIMYVMKGHGASTIWQEGEPEQTIEWHEGSLLAVPLNAWHQEFNASGTEPCRVLFGTNMAYAINHYHNLDFIFNCNYVFKDRYAAGMAKYFSDEGKHWHTRLFETNFIPDVHNFDLDPWPERGIQTSIMRISMASTSLGMHLLDISEGTYVTAHRHQAGAHVIQVEGTGYEMFFMPGDEMDPEKRVKMPIKANGVVAPRLNEYHQHFNTGTGRFRQLAFRGGGVRYGTGETYDVVGAATSANPFSWTYKLRHDAEDPNIREEYYEALGKNGIDLRLQPVDQGGG